MAVSEPSDSIFTQTNETAGKPAQDPAASKGTTTMQLSHPPLATASPIRPSTAYLLGSSRRALAPARSFRGIGETSVADALTARFAAIVDAETGLCRGQCRGDGTCAPSACDDSVYRLRPVGCKCLGIVPGFGDTLVVLPAANATVAKSRRRIIEKWDGPVVWVLHFDVQVRIGREYRNFRYAELIDAAPALVPVPCGSTVRYRIAGAPITSPGQCYPNMWDVGRPADCSPLPGWWGRFQSQCMGDYGLLPDLLSVAA